MTSALRSLLLIVLGVAVGGLLTPTVAACLLALCLMAIRPPDLPAGAWIGIAPALYFAWLFLFLAVAALEAQLYGRLWPKPRRLVVDQRAWVGIRALLVAHRYQRDDIVRALPFARSMLRMPVLQRLVLLSYAHRVRVGQRVLIYGHIYDPDLTEIGDDVIIGGDAAISAHTFLPRGGSVSTYVTAPIRIGSEVTIGGESRIALGVTIGDRAIVEAGAVVDAFTTIPPGEIWGGSPARFHRVTAASGPRAVLASAATPAELITPDTTAAQRLIADALGIGVAHVSVDATTADLDGWDSLGQLAIGMLAHERFGVALEGDEAFALCCVADVERLIGRTSGTPADIAADTPDAALASEPIDTTQPNLLPLYDRGIVTQILARGGRVPPVIRTARVLVVASFTAQSIATSLRLWTRAAGIEVDVDLAPYGQLEGALLDEDGALRTAPADAVRVVLVRAQDLAQDAAGRRARGIALIDAIEQFASRHGSIVVGTMPPSIGAADESARADDDELRAEWRRRLSGIANVDVIDTSAVVERLGTAAAESVANDLLTRNPWSAAASRDLGIEVARAVRRRYIAPHKVVAVDCDGTLWRGVIAEDGLAGIGVGPDGRDRAFQLLQQRLLALKDRGVLIALVSRNDEADVWKVFEQHPGMVLHRTDIAAWRMGWRPKSTLLAEVAAELRLGLDAFVFLDDDPAVRLEVSANAPDVLVVPLPGDPQDRPGLLDRLWAFDGARPSQVDRSRTRLILEEREREVARATTDMPTYLATLGLQVTVAVAVEGNLSRVAQLTQRTNQFNTSLCRRTLDDIRDLPRGATIFTVTASDRYGDYGLIGAAILEPMSSATTTVDTIVMSCRALGRGIEDALLSVLAEQARASGASSLSVSWVDGPRNAPARDFLLRTGFVKGPNGFTAPLDRPFTAPPHIRLVRSAPMPRPSPRLEDVRVRTE